MRLSCCGSDSASDTLVSYFLASHAHACCCITSHATGLRRQEPVWSVAVPQSTAEDGSINYTKLVDTVYTDAATTQVQVKLKVPLPLGTTYVVQVSDARLCCRARLT